MDCGSGRCYSTSRIVAAYVIDGDDQVTLNMTDVYGDCNAVILTGHCIHAVLESTSVKMCFQVNALPLI